MNAKKAVWIIIAFMLCIAVVGMLSSCVIVRTAASQARLKLLTASLPEPERVVLLDEVAGVSSRSDSRCYTAYVHRLYASDRTAEDVFAYFQDTLLSKNEWMQNEPLSGSRKLSFYDRKDGFRLAVDYNLGGYATRGFTRFSEHTLAEARQRFAMPFAVVVNHADAATRENCWLGWEP